MLGWELKSRVRGWVKGLGFSTLGFGDLFQEPWVITLALIGIYRAIGIRANFVGVRPATLYEAHPRPEAINTIP